MTIVSNVGFYLENNLGLMKEIVEVSKSLYLVEENLSKLRTIHLKEGGIDVNLYGGPPNIYF